MSPRRTVDQPERESPDLWIQARGEYKALMHNMQMLAEFLDSVAHGGGGIEEVRELVPELARMRAHLAHHFEIEEEIGFFGDLVRRLPWADGRVQELRDQHPALLEQLDEAIPAAQAAQSSDLESVRTSIDRFLAELRRHELTEGDLFQRAYSVDVGTKD